MAVRDLGQKGIIWSLVIALEALSSVVGGSDSHQVQILPGRTARPRPSLRGAQSVR